MVSNLFLSMLEYLFIFIYVFSGLPKGYIFKDTKYFVPSEDSTSLHIHSLLIRFADWCDSPLSQQVNLKDNCRTPAHMLLPI